VIIALPNYWKFCIVYYSEGFCERMTNKFDIAALILKNITDLRIGQWFFMISFESTLREIEIFSKLTYFESNITIKALLFQNQIMIIGNTAF